MTEMVTANEEPKESRRNNLTNSRRLGGDDEGKKKLALLMKVCFGTDKPLEKPTEGPIARSRRRAGSNESETFDPDGRIEDQIETLMKNMRNKSVKLARIRHKTTLRCKATLVVENWDGDRIIKLYSKQCRPTIWGDMVRLLKHHCESCGAFLQFA